MMENQYFTLFRLPPQFALDSTQLEQTYRTLAAQFHPDKFAAASSFEQKQAVMMSATLNDAYRTLKNPIDRAAYLLQQQGIDADAPEHTAFAPEFLMQQMEWRETLMDARMENDRTALEKLAAEIAAEQNTLVQNLAQAFEQQNFEQAAQQVRHGRFLNKLAEEIRISL